MKKPVHIAITGSASDIAYSLIFRIVSGEMLGTEQPIILHLLESPASLAKLTGIVMEVKDCAYPLLEDIIITDEAEIAFTDVDYAILIADKAYNDTVIDDNFLKENAQVLMTHGRALNTYANRNVKIVALGRPAYSVLQVIPDLELKNFSALTRVDHNRALSQLAERTGAKVTDIEKLAVWGHRTTQHYPSIAHTYIHGRPALEYDFVDHTWLVDEFIPSIQQRDTNITLTQGSASAASVAYAIIEHMRDWVMGTDGKWVSMAVPSDGSYSIPEGLLYSFPCICEAGEYHIVQDLEIDAFSQEYLRLTLEELEKEADEVFTSLGHKFLS